MKRTISSVVTALAVAAGVAVAAMKPGQQMSIQVQSAQLRDTGNYFGKVTENLAYGDRITVEEVKGPWLKVSVEGGKSGWLHESSVTRKKVVLKPGGTDVAAAASGEELALAGKGFNSDVEADFKSKNKDIDFTWIDRMEKIRVSAQEMSTFLAEGQVRPN